MSRKKSIAAVENILLETKCCSYKGGTYPHAIAHLTPIHRARIAIATCGNLVATRKLVHDNSVRTETRQLLGSKLKARGINLGGFAFRVIPLVLYARHVDRI